MHLRLQGQKLTPVVHCKNAMTVLPLGMTTDKALADLLNNDERWLAAWMRAGRTKQDRYYLRKRLGEGKLSVEKKEEFLVAFGFTVKQEKLWQRP
jgi:hypothetical protein